LGGRDVNGTARVLYPYVPLYVGVDLLPGQGVDVVADARDWRPPSWLRFDLVLCTEVLEHAPQPWRICETAWEILRPGGAFVVTCAGPGRKPHSGIDGGPLREGEHYENVDPELLADWLYGFSAAWANPSQDGTDLYAIAVKGEA
jgi:SAM-dependent methyltransferase